VNPGDILVWSGEFAIKRDVDDPAVRCAVAMTDCAEGEFERPTFVKVNLLGVFNPDIFVHAGCSHLRHWAPVEGCMCVGMHNCQKKNGSKIDNLREYFVAG